MSDRVRSGLLFVAALACNDADFGGSNSKSGPPAKDCAGEAACDSDQTPPPASQTCVDGDKLNVQWSGPVKECIIDQSKTYNFELKMCAEMRQASFPCDWASVTKELEERGLLTDVLKVDAQNGSKLVSCGQSEDGDRIVVQWIRVPEGGSFDCSAIGAEHRVVSGCYTVYGPGDDQPPPATNDEERARQVYGCMNRL